MQVSQKCQYAARAVFELARRQGDGPVTIGEIARIQAIPQKFLEVILGELKQTGYVASRRGVQGGYLLEVSPEVLTVGDVVRFIDGPLDPVKCIGPEIGAEAASTCPLKGDCAFMGLWARAGEAVAGVYDSTTFQDLIDEHEAATQEYVPHYNI